MANLSGTPPAVRGGLAPKPRLIARKEAGVIEVDTLTTLRGVPPEAWDYRLGAYSALEWVIDLLCRVCRVSVETMKIIRQMPR